MKKYVFGNEMNRMPDIHFCIMSVIIKAREALFRFSNRLDNFDIEHGFTVMDYGCGPGAYVPKAAELVGENGTLYAVDIHPLAIESVDTIISQRDLPNVKSVLVDEYECPLPDNVADLIYILDAFHMIQDTDTFLGEIYRLIKPSGVLYLDDGHQSRKETKRKIVNSGLWSVSEENKDHIRCSPNSRS